MPPLAMILAMLMLILMTLVDHLFHLGSIAAFFVVLVAVYLLLTLIVLTLYLRLGDWRLIYGLFRESFIQVWKEIETYLKRVSK